MHRLSLSATLAAATAIAAVALLASGCGAGGGGAAVADAVIGDDLLRNIAAVVGVTPEGGARDRSQDVRLRVANLDTVRGEMTVRFLATDTRTPQYLLCADPRVEGGASDSTATTADIVCSVPAGEAPWKPEQFQVCGDNGCGPAVAEQWYYYPAPPTDAR